jgi:metal-dependent HD superfamily phosphatase/phosphodiesterase
MAAPDSKEYRNQYESTLGEIRKNLRSKENLNSLLTFEALIENDYINNRYKYAEVDNDNRFLNRYDKLHALKVTSYSLKLFDALKHEDELIHKARISKLQFTTMALYELPQDYSCMTVVTAAYTRNICEYMLHHNLAAALMISREFENLRFLDSPERSRVNRILPIIEQCILLQEGGGVKAQNVEQAIVMLADSTDNDKDRNRGTFGEAEVVRNDRNPIEYLACRDVESVKIGPSEHGKLVEATFELTGEAGWYQVHNFYRALENSGLANLIALCAHKVRIDRATGEKVELENIQVWPPENNHEV